MNVFFCALRLDGPFFLLLGEALGDPVSDPRLVGAAFLRLVAGRRGVSRLQT